MLSETKKTHFPPYFADFFDRSAATAYKNPLRLTKNGHFFVSDATTLTSYNLDIVANAVQTKRRYVISHFPD